MPSSTRSVYGVARWSGPYYGTGSTQLIKDRISLTKSDTVKTAEHALRGKRPHIWLPPTPFSATTHEEHIGSAYHYDNYGDYQIGTAWSPWNTMPDYNLAANFPDLRGLAVTRALAHLKDQKVNYAQAFAERRQTAKLVTSSLERFATGMDRLVLHHDPKGFANAFGFSYKKSFKGVRETWLETQYGWKPLLSDVHGAMEDLRKKDLADPQRYRITVRGSARDVFDKFFTSSSSFMSYGPDQTCQYAVGYQRSSKVVLHYYMDNPDLARLAATGFTNPLQLAWELLPWSFVYDWFVPIGGYLSSMDAALGYKFVGGCGTDRFTFLGKTYSMRSTSFANGGTTSSGHSRVRKAVRRDVYTSSPLPRFPGFKNPFSLVHLGNALALLGSKVR